MPDIGDIKLDVDLSMGAIAIGVRPALGLESARVTVAMSIEEFLDHAAHLQLKINELTRLARQQAPRPRIGGGA